MEEVFGWVIGQEATSHGDGGVCLGHCKNGGKIQNTKLFAHKRIAYGQRHSFNKLNYIILAFKCHVINRKKKKE